MFKNTRNLTENSNNLLLINCVMIYNIILFRFVQLLQHNHYIKYFKIKIMNLNRIFGSILTLLGIAGLIYTAVLFSQTSGSNRDIKTLIIYGVLGILFFSTGISLVKTTKDES